MVNHNMDFLFQGDNFFEGIFGLGPPRTASAQYAGGPELSSLFIEDAGIETFSVCLSGPTTGALILQPNTAGATQFNSIGEHHWVVGIEGLSLGTKSTKKYACAPADKPNSQVTPCGALPDSGTTLVYMKRQLKNAVMDQMCHEWDLCAKNPLAVLKLTPKHRLLGDLVAGCALWSADIYKQLPPLKIHVTGTEADSGNKQILTLPSTAYIFKVDIPIFRWAKIRAQRDWQKRFWSETFDHVEKGHHARGTPGGAITICVPGIDEMEWNSDQYGPIMILGLQLFRQYQVGFSMVDKTVSFSEEPCESCSSGGVVSRDRKRTHQHMPSELDQPLRRPRHNTKGPL